MRSAAYSFIRKQLCLCYPRQKCHPSTEALLPRYLNALTCFTFSPRVEYTAHSGYHYFSLITAHLRVKLVKSRFQQNSYFVYKYGRISIYFYFPPPSLSRLTTCQCIRQTVAPIRYNRASSHKLPDLPQPCLLHSIFPRYFISDKLIIILHLHTQLMNGFNYSKHVS